MNRDKPQFVIIPLSIFRATLAARVARVQREQAEIARTAWHVDPNRS
jgi:hypothetical protein